MRLIITAGLAAITFGFLTWRLFPSLSCASLKFIQLTDLHLPGDSDSINHSPRALGFRAAIAEINAMRPVPKFVVITGDIAEHAGEEGSYRLFKSMAAQFRMPLYLALGNHDRRSVFRREVLHEDAPHEGAFHYSFDYGGRHFVVLDSSQPGSAHGFIDRKQLDWLEQDLKLHKQQLTFIFLHHHSILIGAADCCPLQNAGEFLGLISNFPNVIVIANGHTHFSQVLRVNRKFIVNTMSLSDGHSKDAGSPGYRVFEVTCDGRLRFYDKRLGEEAREEFPEE